MKVLFLTAMAGLGAFALLYGAQGPATDDMTVGATSAGPSGMFELSQGAQRCLLHRSPSAKNAREIVGYGCEAMLPAFSEGLYWIDRNDGSVAFTTKEGRNVVEFGQADGLDYQSTSPRDPIFSLVERR